MKVYVAYAVGPKGSDSVIDCGTFSTIEAAHAAIESRGLDCAEIETIFTKETTESANVEVSHIETLISEIEAHNIAVVSCTATHIVVCSLFSGKQTTIPATRHDVFVYLGYTSAPKENNKNIQKPLKNYSHTVDGLSFQGSYTIEEDDEGYNPIFTVDSIFIGHSPDLMLVIDPRVIHEIEASLLADYKWNTK